MEKKSPSRTGKGGIQDRVISSWTATKEWRERVQGRVEGEGVKVGRGGGGRATFLDSLKLTRSL